MIFRLIDFFSDISFFACFSCKRNHFWHFPFLLILLCFLPAIHCRKLSLKKGLLFQILWIKMKKKTNVQDFLLKLQLLSHWNCLSIPDKKHFQESLMVSIKDVAQLANVSIATVSRVINSPERVSEKRRTIVLDAIKHI